MPKVAEAPTMLAQKVPERKTSFMLRPARWKSSSPFRRSPLAPMATIASKYMIITTAVEFIDMPRTL